MKKRGSVGEDKVKIIHANDLKTWTRFPEYRDHDGPTLGEYRTLQKAAEAVKRALQDLVRAKDKLVELEVERPLEYARHEISLPRSFWPGQIDIPLPLPDYQASTISCDAGEMFGQVLRIHRSWRKRSVTARYACPSRILNADKIAKLKDTLSSADEETHSRLVEAETSLYLQPVLFISHRWEGTDHPDPDGRQLFKLQALEDCFLIYDYTSFPQDTTSPEDEAVLLEILSGMNAMIEKVLVLAAPDFLERGWCIYEYTVASMRASIVCDELNDPDFVLLRNLAATRPPGHLGISGGGLESEIQNAKNQRTLETVNTILPLFNRSKFTVERDREIVRNLLVEELVQMLPGKKEYMQYVGEWKTIAWTEEELREAFNNELKWEELQYFDSFKPFEPKVPSTVVEAAINGYRLDQMPRQDDLTWATLIDSGRFGDIGEAIAKGVLIGGLIVVGGVTLALVLLFLLVWWIFF